MLNCNITILKGQRVKPLSRKWLKKRRAPKDLTGYILERPHLELVPILNLMVSEGHQKWVEWIVQRLGRLWDVKKDWGFVYPEDKSYWNEEQKEFTEHPQANPDVFSEEKAFWPQRQKDKDEPAMMEAIKAAYKEATETECRAFDLVGSRGYTYRRAAVELDTTESNVHEAIVRFRRLCIRQYKLGEIKK